MSLSEITGMEGNVITMQEIFSFKQEGVNPEGHATGRFKMTGIMPQFVDRFKAAGVSVPKDIFNPNRVMEV
jgi:pilus assembly protein CpaF